MAEFQINFDTAGNPELSTFILAHKDGRIIGELSNITNVTVKGNLKEAHEITFTLHKRDGSFITPFWDEITDFKLVLCKEWGTWFEVKIVKNQKDGMTKEVKLTKLGEAELSQLSLYDFEANTEDDIARPEYTEPTILYNPNNPESSLLHRMLKDKAPHYSIRHVDDSIRGIQRTFSFNDRTLDECFTEIEDELNILFVYDSDTNDMNKGITINRTISVYDMLSYCKNCEHRGEFTVVCPKCGSTNISEGYGEDTTICVDSECLGNEMTIEVDTENIKNCYRLSAGDDLMTATIKSCNPNGSHYIWHVSSEEKKDMTAELVEKLDRYKADYSYYQKQYSPTLQSSTVYEYNSLVDKYKPFNENLEGTHGIVGYPQIMKTMWDIIDFKLFLQYDLMPSPAISNTSAYEQSLLLNEDTLSPVAIANMNYLSESNVKNAVLGLAKVSVDNRYAVKIKYGSLVGEAWNGVFTVTNLYDTEDSCDTDEMTIQINADYEAYIRQKLTKQLESNKNNISVSSLFELPIDEFEEELHKYSQSGLTSLNDACQACISILQEQGIHRNETWADKDPNMYEEVYVPYTEKLEAIQLEIVEREYELNVLDDFYNQLDIVKNGIQEVLNFENYLGTKHWLEFSAYRRESSYTNNNYISDGLTNGELFKRAYEFIENAESAIEKANSHRHQITTTMKNLLVIKEFEQLKKYFKIGNWIRIKDDDENLYKLRLMSFEINFDNLENINVTFSDAVKIANKGVSIKDTIAKTSSIIKNYNSTIQNAVNNYISLNDRVEENQQNSNLTNNTVSDSVNGKVDKDTVIDSINSSGEFGTIDVSKLDYKALFNRIFTVSNIDIGVGAPLPSNHIYIYYQSGNDDGTDTGSSGEYLYSYGTTSDEIGSWNTYQYLNEAGGAEMGSVIEAQESYLYMYKPLSTKRAILKFFSSNPIDIDGHSTLNITYSYIGNYPEDFIFGLGDGYSNDTWTGAKTVFCKRTSSSEEIDTSVSLDLSDVTNDEYRYIYIAYLASANTTRSAEIKVKRIWLE